MSVASGPPELPPDSPGSSVSSRLQNEYEDLLRRAVVITHEGLKMNQSALGLGQKSMNKKKEKVTDLIDLSSPDTNRTDISQSEIETERQQLAQIPSLQQLLQTAASNSPNNENLRSTPRQSDDPLMDHLLRYSEMISDDLESKPITEKMDHWYLDLKKNLMTEFDKLRLQFLEEAQQSSLREKQTQAKEYARLNQDIKTMREMLIHYEHIIDQKDQTEKNLNKALDLLYNKTLAYRRYYEWKIIHMERRQQDYALSLAKRFYEEKIKRKTLFSWKNFTEREWKKRFEIACEKKAKDVLIDLGNEYELKYKQLELQLLNAQEEIARLKVDKDDHDEALKKAFMRGVCALNMEAMSVLLKDENEQNDIQKSTYHPKTIMNSEYDSSDEGMQITGEEETTTTSKSACEQRRLPVHVYKEYLPSTIYRTGEARTVRGNSNTNRHVTFNKRPTSTTNRIRSTQNTVFVERHAPANNYRS